MNSLQTLDHQELSAIEGGLMSTGSLGDLIYLLFNSGQPLV